MERMLWPCFIDGVQLRQGYRSTTRTQFKVIADIIYIIDNIIAYIAQILEPHTLNIVFSYYYKQHSMSDVFSSW